MTFLRLAFSQVEQLRNFWETFLLALFELTLNSVNFLKKKEICNILILMTTRINSTLHALKEWNVAVNALARGQTILLLRKGGIREVEGSFAVKHTEILLYPTYEHQKPDLLKPEYAEKITPVESGWHPQTVRIGSWAEITDIFCVSDEAVVNQLLPYHIWNDRFVFERFHWKPRQPLYLLLLRVYRLQQAENIPYHSTYGGCQSWLDLHSAIALEESLPVLATSEYNRRVEAIRHELIKN